MMSDNNAGLKVILFDCFGTVFDMSGVNREEITEEGRDNSSERIR